MTYILDVSKAKKMHLSNDAFFWLKYKESPIDDSNLKEAQDILKIFPNGFIIKDDWKYINENVVEATFIPFTENIITQWDGEHRAILKNGKADAWVFCFKILNHNRCYAKWYNSITNKLIYEGECEIKYFHKKPWAIIQKGNQIPLWNESTKYLTNNRF